VEGIKCFSPFQFFIVLLQVTRFDCSLWISFLEVEWILGAPWTRTVTQDWGVPCHLYSNRTLLLWLLSCGKRNRNTGRSTSVSKSSPGLCRGDTFHKWMAPSDTLMKVYKKP